MSFIVYKHTSPSNKALEKATLIIHISLEQF